MRMTNDVRDSFFGGEEDVVAEFGRDRRIGQLRRDVEAIFQAGDGEIFLGVFADVIDEAVERVVGGIDGPDDLVEGMSCVAGGLRNLAGVSFHIGRRIFVGLS